MTLLFCYLKNLNQHWSIKFSQQNGNFGFFSFYVYQIEICLPEDYSNIYCLFMMKHFYRFYFQAQIGVMENEMGHEVE